GSIVPLTKILEASGLRESLEDEPFFHKKSTVTMDDAAYALIAIGADAVTPLLSLLDAPHEWTRMNAIFALGEIGPSSQPAVPRLMALLDDPSHRIIRYAAIALGTIGDSDSQGALCDLLSVDADGWDELIDNNWPIRFLVHVNAAMALAKMGKQASDSEAALIHHLNHPCGHVGMFLTEALKRIGTTTAKEALLKDLEFRRWDSSLHEERQF
ncbi:MAG: HEAT repeat domain-containing protein, partial [Candidatus Latescibacteria bacterium]|nr:HEAT repeat domain-containing protein [Candidatus Latescibacterota bacterium]